MSGFTFSCPACHQDVLCDTALVGKDIACPICKAVITVPKETAGAASAPAGNPSAPPDHGAPVVQRTSRLAIASLVCSLLSLVTCLGWLPGIICGHMAKSRIRRNPALKGRGLATAGLVIGYLVLLSEVGSAAFYAWRVSTAMKQGFEDARQALATNNFIVVQTPSATVSNETQPAEPVPGNALVTSNKPAESTPPAIVTTNNQPTEPVKPVTSLSTGPGNAAWTADLSNVSFPGYPVSGKLHELGFVLHTTSFRNADLRMKSADGVQLDVYRLGTSIEGHSYDIQPDDDDQNNPRVKVTWNEGGATQTATFSKGYGMKLQFGYATNRRVSGKIYLCLPDDSKSFVAGTFEVRLPRPQ
jgi:hypothetical protein